MKLLATGGGGQVARALQTCAATDVTVIAPGRRDLDICDRSALIRAIAEAEPDLLVNCAAFTAVDAAEADAERAMAVNGAGAENAAYAAHSAGLPLLHLSTDYVFDGAKASPYVEDDAPNPMSAYGRSKLAGEAAVRRQQPRHIILRTAWVFAASGQNFVLTLRRLAAEGRDQFRVVADQIGGPTAADDIAECILRMAQSILSPAFEAWGTYHFCGQPVTSWHGFATAILRDRPGCQIEAIPSSDWPTPAPRPANSVLGCGKIKSVFEISQPDWRKSLDGVLSRLQTT